MKCLEQLYSIYFYDEPSVNRIPKPTWVPGYYTAIFKGSFGLFVGRYLLLNFFYLFLM